MTGSSVVVTDAEAPPRPATWADVRLLGWMVLTDLVFVAGVLVPYLTRADQPTAGGPAWLGWPALASIYLLPLVAVAVAAVAAGRLGAAARSWWPGLVALSLAVGGLRGVRLPGRGGCRAVVPRLSRPATPA